MGWKWLVIAAFERNVLIQFAQVFSHMDVTAILCVRVCVCVLCTFFKLERTHMLYILTVLCLWYCIEQATLQCVCKQTHAIYILYATNDRNQNIYTLYT